MYRRKQRRRNGIIGRLSFELREKVNQMLNSGATYQEIVDLLADNDVKLSKMAVCNYARKYLASTQALKVAQDKFAMLMDEVDKTSDLDITEALLRITSNALLNAVSNANTEDWDSMSLEQLLKEANALARATSQKRRVDMQNRTAIVKPAKYLE